MPDQRPSLAHRDEADRSWPMLVWRFDPAVQAISSAPFGGGLTTCGWVINATVAKDYHRRDPDGHVREIAAGVGLAGPGVGMLTAVDVAEATTGTDGGVTAVATVGLGHPTWAAAPDGDLRPSYATINVVVLVPAVLTTAAMVNAVITTTEAKVQALWEYGTKATGTASDAVFVACSVSGDRAEPFAGPRSVWGARIARAVHQAVATGTAHWTQRYGR